MAFSIADNLDVEIFARVVQPAEPQMRPQIAQALLEMNFDEQDVERMDVLAEKCRQGQLTPDEQHEIDSYDRVSAFLAIMKSKARQSLRALGDSTHP